MNGAESLIQTLANSGVAVCFTNPGTTEIHLLRAVQKMPGMRSILGLYEGVCTGAADGYGRMADRPAMTLLHLGPGLANGLSNLHNAKRAHSPVINVVGDHATCHRQYDAPLAADIVSMAKCVSDWVRSSGDAVSLAADGAAALTAAMEPPGHVATLIVPSDCAWNQAKGPAGPVAPLRYKPFSQDAATRAAAALRSGRTCAMLMTGRALRKEGLEAAGRIARATGAQVLCDRFNARLERGAGRFPIDRMPYFPEHAQKRLAGLSHLILVGSKPPVSFFAYPGTPGWLTPKDCEILTLTGPGDDPVAALEALGDLSGAGGKSFKTQDLSKPDLPAGDLNAAAVGAALGALMPEHAIVSDDSATSGAAAFHLTTGAPPHDWLFLTGGSIGQGLPVATGAAVAFPDRKVICLAGDGGAMYTLQSLWTQARERLDITTVIFSNRKYLILQMEFMRLAGESPTGNAREMMDLSNPDLDWVRLANGLGVNAGRAETAEDFTNQFRAAMAEPGPHLIEAIL